MGGGGEGRGGIWRGGGRGGGEGGVESHEERDGMIHKISVLLTHFLTWN